MYGRAIGNMAKVGVNTFVGAGWESAVEAQSFMKDSESKYKEYFKICMVGILISLRWLNLRVLFPIRQTAYFS